MDALLPIDHHAAEDLERGLGPLVGCLEQREQRGALDLVVDLDRVAQRARMH